MKRTFSALVESVKRKKWKAFVATLCVAVLLVTLAAGCRGNQPMAPDGGGGDSPGVTTTTTAATTATIKDEPLATTTGDELTGTTTTTVNTSSTDETVTTTQGGSASVTKTTASKTKVTKTTATKTTSGKKDYLDTSKLTGTQEDVGKVVGYDSLFNEEVTVVRVTEGVNNRGLKYVETTFSDGSSSCVVECEHCHRFPCPDGGGEACSRYDVKLDATKTCQQCGRPKGDGHNGTCHRTIDWDNGGKVICHHYD